MSFGVQSTQPGGAGRPRTAPRHDGAPRGLRGGHRGGLRDLEHGPHRRLARRDRSTTSRATLDDLLGLEHPPPHISCYALTPEPGDAARRDPARHPDEDEPPTPTTWWARPWRRHGYALGGDLELGAARATSAATTTSTGTRATTSASARPPTRTSTGGGTGTCARPIATSRWCDRGDVRSGGEEVLDERDADASSATRSRCAPRAASPRRGVRVTRGDRAPRRGARRARHAGPAGSTAREPGDRPSEERELAR